MCLEALSLNPGSERDGWDNLGDHTSSLLILFCLLENEDTRMGLAELSQGLAKISYVQELPQC